jgi:hypothetical protein
MTSSKPLEAISGNLGKGLAGNYFKQYIGKQLGLDLNSGRQNAIEKFSMGIIASTSSKFVMYCINKTSAPVD